MPAPSDLSLLSLLSHCARDVTAVSTLQFMGAACKEGEDADTCTHCLPSLRGRGDPGMVPAYIFQTLTATCSSRASAAPCLVPLGIWGAPGNALEVPCRSAVSFFSGSSGHPLLPSEDAGLSGVGYTLSEGSLSSTAWGPLLYQSNEKAHF